ncbi:hypothetical protein JCGZ_17204 [Jatropha curcas]|uniref:Uncharacterized protein n=2 Tax=Jatropha curcas TaxID=180498 RepID=A0A067LB14_JATCU|nr:O-acyltransferase WSD1 isoform X1 [Jatropha curcas]KDP45597.1 hypothetical protein JCGZ_17204 [Jatropha curcas]
MQGLKPIRVRKEEEEEKKEEGEPLSPVARIFHESHSNAYITVFMGFKTPVNLTIFKANITKTLLKHPRLSSLQVMDEKRGGEMKWVKTEINLDDHIIVPVIDHQNIDCPDKFVEDYASNLSKTQISKSKPMWDFHFLNIKTSEAESTVIFRVHHSIGDGISLMSLLISFSRKASDLESLPTIPTVKKRYEKNSGGGFRQFLERLWRFLVLCWNTFVGLVMIIATVLFLEDTETPIKGSGDGSVPRRFVHRTISLDDVKSVKNAMGTTVNDVMVGITQAGLSQYLNRRYAKLLNVKDTYAEEDKKEGEATKSKSYLPKNIRMRASFIVNLRKDSGIQALDEMMRKGTKAKWGNKVGYVLYPFTIKLRDDPLDYVRDAKVVGERKKASLEALYAYLGNRFLLRFFGIKKFGLPSQTTLCFSSVPGPQEEISFYEHPMSYIAPTCYGQPNALLIHVVSYVNKMKIVLSVDENIIPDPHQLCDDIQNSLKLIKNSLIAKGLLADS